MQGQEQEIPVVCLMIAALIIELIIAESRLEMDFSTLDFSHPKHALMPYDPKHYLYRTIPVSQQDL
jgi:hypothetical protein